MGNRAKVGNYSRIGHTIYVTENIINLIKDRKLRKAKKILHEELEISPNDKHLRSLLLHCNFLEHNYEEILNVEKDLEEEDLLKVTIAAIKINAEEKLKYLYNNYYCNYTPKEHIDKEAYRMLKYYLIKKFEPNINLDINKMSYKEKMVWNYDEQHAINYIKSNYCNLTSSRNMMLSPSIDLEDLYYLAKESIEHNKGKECLGKIGESYIFHYPNCGFLKDSKTVCDYLVVSVVVNTKDILSIIPTTQPDKDYYPGISEFITLKQKQEEKPKIRVKTGLDSFNAKYNK